VRSEFDLMLLDNARDAAQESLLKLTTRLRQFRGECQFSTWLHRLSISGNTGLFIDSMCVPPAATLMSKSHCLT
jgi:hypothetical protein